ncbi:uncharacterized protein LOC110853421 [Folsomia candida]|uniref:uncharacterized protein LOC110853421 n=1 Tax=Folsomia candida TaxID=158441 RepID=UPI000B8F9566|nr:uncharacterized protein LOC110853421 [Folsomia candida]
MIFSRITILLLLVASSTAFVQEMTLHSGLSCTGPGFTFETKEPNLANWEFFLPSVQSIKVVGWWYFYTGVNFSPYQSHTNFRSSTYCFNSTYPTVSKSLRYVGPLETTTPSISIYDGASAVSTEKIFTTSAANNFGFEAEYVIVSGMSSWTLYYNDDFTGNTTCVNGNGGLVGSNRNFRSATMGCNSLENKGNATKIGNPPTYTFS